MEGHQSQMFGTYRVIRPIGKGGFAQVYLVEDNLGRQWALKKIHQDLIKQDPSFRDRFEREARIQAGLRHDHIAGVHTFNAEEGYLVIDYIDGKTLQNLLDDDYPDGMDLHTSLEILRPIEEALTYIHKEAGFAHLDVTPRNILIQERHTHKGRTEWNIVLADFGLARVIDSDGQADLSMFAGAPGYWAPEQRGPTKDKPGTRSDIYSLGLVIGVMLTDRKAQDVLDILRGTNNTLASTLPLEVKHVLQRATEEDSANRYATVKGLVTAFTRVVEASDREKTLTASPDEGAIMPTRIVTGNPDDARTGRLKKIVAKGSLYYAIATTIVLLVLVTWTLVQNLPITHWTSLGGVDLGKYCSSLNYDENISTMSCASPINLTNACNWQYTKSDLRAGPNPSNPGDPLDVQCYNHENDQGGISQFDSYCKDPRQNYHGTPVVNIVGNKWVCESKIDVKTVCIWEYNRTDVLARLNDQKFWECDSLF